jgi:hypothetical protein
MVRRVIVAVAAVALVLAPIYAAAIAGDANPVGGGDDTVPRCQVRSYTARDSTGGTTQQNIGSVVATVRCSHEGDYMLRVTVASGSSSSSGSASFGYNPPGDVTVTTSLSSVVTISANRYTVTFEISK